MSKKSKTLNGDTVALAPLDNQNEVANVVEDATIPQEGKIEE